MLLDLLVGVAVALAVSCVVCAAMVKSGPLDMPTAARKVHRAPTPTSGGVGIAAGFAAGLIALGFYSATWRHELTTEGAALLSAGAASAYGFLIVGFVDDAHPLTARLKLALFTVLSVGLALSMGVVETLPLGNGVSLPIGFWLGLLGTTAWIFVLVNCVNFMDGANGLAMGSVAIGLLTLGGIAYAAGLTGAMGMTSCAAAALGGFLIWNFPRGKLFAGDSGALFAGALAAAVSLLVIHRADVSPFIPPIVFFPLLSDALLTLAWRAQRGRSLLDGHSEHLYQIAMRAGWSHTQIACAYWASMAVCGAIAFAASRVPHTGAAWIALVLLVFAALAASYHVRRLARQRGIEWMP